MKICESFSKIGNKVNLFTYDIISEKEKLVRDDFKFYGVNKRFKIHVVRVSKNIVLRELKYFFWSYGK